MKRFYTVFLFAFALCMAAQAQAIATFDKSTHKFGTFPESKLQTHVFYVTNTGDKPLIINQTLSTCGCTVSEFTKTPIAPGERGQVKVSYNGKGRSFGHFKKTITVRTNASNALVRLFIEGDMVKEE